MWVYNLIGGLCERYFNLGTGKEDNHTKFGEMRQKMA
jgi:hypothetical protein